MGRLGQFGDSGGPHERAAIVNVDKDDADALFECCVIRARASAFFSAPEVIYQSVTKWKTKSAGAAFC